MIVLHKRKSAIPEYRQAPPGKFRHAFDNPDSEFRQKQWNDILLSEIGQVIDANPNADIYNEEGRRVDRNGQPNVFSG